LGEGKEKAKNEEDEVKKKQEGRTWKRGIHEKPK
jgi:hypothetical protein